MNGLKNSFPQILKNGACLYGGNQGDHPRKLIQKYGCGVISSVDLAFYLHLYKKGCKGKIFEGCSKPQVQLSRYNEWVSAFSKNYLPVIPGFGINGLTLVFGLNRYFWQNKIPFRARWCAGGKKLWRRMDKLLSADLPVIFAVGPNLPVYWGKYKLNLYSRIGEENYRKVTEVKAHYMTVTAADDAWLRASSWGRTYYVNKKEYEEYVKKHSNFLVSNLVFLKPIKQKGG